MKRITRNGTVLYVERHLLWSGLYLAGTLVGGLILFELREAADRSFPAVLLVGILVLAFFAVRNLSRARVFRIDRAGERLEYFERSWPWRRWKQEWRLADLTVVLERRRYRHTVPSRHGGSLASWEANVGRLLIAVEGAGSVVFLKGVRGKQAPHLAQILADDLGRPLKTIDKSV